jgi:uncharacterized phage-like protein YoqJ
MDRSKIFKWTQEIGFFIEVSLFVASGYLMAKGNTWFFLTFGLGLWIALVVADLIQKYSVMKYKEDNDNNGT